MPATNESSGGSWRPDRKLLAAGIVAGLAIGAAAVTRNTPPRTNPTISRQLIDWERARSIAITMNRAEALSPSERVRLDALYRELGAACLPLISAYTGDALPVTPERTYAFDRVDWINANITGFQRMLEPLETLGPLLTGAAAGGLIGRTGQTVVAGELGLMLGYLARRVLGQYDLALLGREPIATGQLYYVEPNIAEVERTLRIPGRDFRMWLALHETTHAFEFEAHPWLRDHFNTLLERYFVLLNEDARRLRDRGVRGFGMYVDRARAAQGESGWMSALMTPEQRAVFDEMQAVMCVVEGYSNHVMNAIGRDLLPTYADISRKFAERQLRKSSVDQFIAKVTGLTVKMEQYRLGEAFIDQVSTERGHAMAHRVWDGPEFLPTLEEIRHPERWIARIDARDRAAARP